MRFYRAFYTTYCCIFGFDLTLPGPTCHPLGRPLYDIMIVLMSLIRLLVVSVISLFFFACIRKEMAS